MAKAKLNFGVILKHLDLRNLELYEAFRHNADERKEFERVLAYLLPLWYSGVFDGNAQFDLMIKFNRQVNVGWWELDGHPELRAKLLAAIGIGRAVKHDFHYREPQRSENALAGLLTQCYPDIRKDEIQLWCSVNSEANLLDLCSNHGVQIKEREQIIEQYRRLAT